jgi:hypothetical protein
VPKRHTAKNKYVESDAVVAEKHEISIVDVALKAPTVVAFFDTSIIKQHQAKIDWKLYKIEIRENVPYIVREMCDRCGKVWIPVRWRKLREYTDKDIGKIYLETGLCKDCINAGLYVDTFLDGDVLTEVEAKNLFYEYAESYEKAWRVVIAAAPRIAMTEQEWKHRCNFFKGCAVCGGAIEVRAKYFPLYLNGAHTAWNIIPMCNVCLKRHYRGRVTRDKTISRYKVFSSREFFNKSKTIRMYLLHEMEKHNIYIDPLQPFRTRFRETKTLEGSD